MPRVGQRRRLGRVAARTAGRATARTAGRATAAWGGLVPLCLRSRPPVRDGVGADRLPPPHGPDARDRGHPGPRAPAPGSQRVGTLVVNPGGPGKSGNQVLPVALGLLPAAVRRSFDVVSFDPRGTGSSDRLRCGTRPQALTSAIPLPTAPGRRLPGTAAFAAMARRCATRAPGVAPFLDSTGTARDMDRIRQALGVPRISFYGLSYGTVLGTAYAALYPGRVAGMALDGAVEVDATFAELAIEQGPAAERSLGHLLAACSAQPSCPLGADPRATFTSVADSLSRHPLPAPGPGDPYPVTVGDLDTAALAAVSLPLLTAPFEAAVAWGHTWLLSGSGDACVQRLVSASLIGASLPRPGAVCG